MKRYLFFAGGTYYALGGWDDFIGDYDSQDEIEEIVKIGTEKGYIYDWYHIVDLETKEIVNREGYA